MIWYYWKVHGADWKWAVLLLSEGRSVQVQRELRVKANTLPGFWWDGTVTFSHNSPRQLSPQSHKPGGRYDSTTNVSDLIWFLPKGKIKKPFAFLAIYMMHLKFCTCGQWQISSCVPWSFRSASTKWLKWVGWKQPKQVSCQANLS